MNDSQISLIDPPKLSAVTGAPLGAADACCDVNHAEHEVFEAETGQWDRWGLWLSSLCAVHCAVLPFVAIAIPMLEEIFHQEWVHLVMALFVVPVGLIAFWSGYKHHRQARVFSLGVVGLSLVGLASVLPHEMVEIGHLDVVTIMGSICLIAAHIVNRRACLCHKPEHQH